MRDADFNAGADAATFCTGRLASSPGASSLQATNFAKLNALVPGAVTPEGWLKLHLTKQADHLLSKLPVTSWPFTQAFWSGGEDTGGREWWGWEQKGYWVDGALRCALVLRDESLLASALKPVNYTLKHASPDGYLGPAYLRNPEERWPQHVFFRGVEAYADATGDPRIVPALRRHFLADFKRADGFYEKLDRGSMSTIENLLWLYDRTGERQFLDEGKRIWDHFQATIAVGDRGTWDLHHERVMSGVRIRAHGVSYAEVAKIPAILYMYSGDPEYLRFAIAAQERMFSHHMLIDGIPSSAEEFLHIDARWRTSCNISDMQWGWDTC